MKAFDAFVVWITASGTGGAAVISALIAVSIFLLTRVWEIFQRWSEARAARKRVVIGMWTEVYKNLREVEQFLDANPSSDFIKQKVLADPAFRPLLIINESTKFFQAVTASLPDIKSDSLTALSTFYDQIDTVFKIRTAFESNAFLTISAAGRASTVDELWKAARQAEKGGWKALYELKLAYPRRWFKL